MVVHDEVAEYLITDGDWLWMMVLNLLTNAIKHTKAVSMGGAVALAAVGRPLKAAALKYKVAASPLSQLFSPASVPHAPSAWHSSPHATALQLGTSESGQLSESTTATNVASWHPSWTKTATDAVPTFS